MSKSYRPWHGWDGNIIYWYNDVSSDFYFALFVDEMFLQAFKDHGIEHIVNRLSGSQQSSAIRELAAKVINRLGGEQESSTTSSSD